MPQEPNATFDSWFEAIECDDEELVKSMAEKDPSLLVQTFVGAEYEADIKDLANELLGAKVGNLTPLQYACFVESEDSALVLTDLATNQQLLAKWGDQNTLFHLAAFNGLELLIKKLLKRGVPSTFKNKKGFRPMDCVANDATRDVFVNFDEDEEEEEMPVIKESRPKKMVDKTELPQPHTKKDEDSEYEDDSEYEIPEYPPLRRIDMNASPSKSSLRSRSSKKPNKVQFDTEPTFFDCCRNGELDLVKDFILKQKLSPNTKTFLGITVLHMAVESGNSELASFLIQQGAQVNAVDMDGWSPIHLACSNGDVNMFKLLIKHGANVNALTNEGEYPLELAEADELKTLIQKTPGFDISTLEIIKNKPREEEEEEIPKLSPQLKKLRRKSSDLE